MKLRDRIRLQLVVRDAVRRRAHSIEDLVRLCEIRIGKRITLVRLPSGLPISGAVRQTSDAATIYFSSGGEWRERGIVAHELAHLFLGHVCSAVGSPALTDVLALFESLPRETVITALERAGFVAATDTQRTLGSSDYEDPAEGAAETLANKILVLTLASDADFRSLSTYQRIVSNSSLIATFMGPQ